MSSLLDPIGASLSLLSTICFVRALRFAWGAGFAAVIINTILYYQKGLYGQVGLEFVYFFMMVYGWILWDPEKTPDKTTSFQYLTRKQWVYLGLVQLLAIPLLSLFLKTYTDTDVPLQDATIVSVSLSAQFLLCHKFMECWIFWFVVDLLIAILQFDKGIPYHAFVHLVYLSLAVAGHIHWHKLKETQPSTIVFEQP